MGKLEMGLWACDFLITGVGWAFGGSAGAIFCFLVGGILVFLVVAKEDKNSVKPPTLKKWHRYGMATFALATILLGGIAVVRLATRKSMATAAPQNSVQTTPAQVRTSQQAPQQNQPSGATIQTIVKHKAAKKPALLPSVSTSGNNSPAVGSITQGAGSALSFGQQGGITAGTVNNNYSTPERHLTSEQTTALDGIATSVPNDTVLIETVSDPDAINFAGEIEKVFEAHNKAKNVNTRLFEHSPVPKGIYVLLQDDKSQRFDIAQQIAIVLQKTAPVQFTRQDGLTATQVKIVIGFR